jgi:hypothetical protein
VCAIGPVSQGSESELQQFIRLLISYRDFQHAQDVAEYILKEDLHARMRGAVTHPPPRGGAEMPEFAGARVVAPALRIPAPRRSNQGADAMAPGSSTPPEDDATSSHWPTTSSRGIPRPATSGSLWYGCTWTPTSRWRLGDTIIVE